MIRNVLTQSWPEIAMLSPEKSVIFLGIAPIEEHGRHLPTGVDFFETNCWIHDAATLLEAARPDYFWGILPAIPLGYANMGKFPGNIHVSRELIYQVILESVSAIAAWGVKNIVVISGHADPLHTIAIEQAVEKVNEENGLTAIAPMGAIFQSEKLTAGSDGLSAKQTAFPADFHAGWVETSCMLAAYPQYINGNYRERPDILLDSRDMGNLEKITAAIQGEGHIGFPKEASAELGVELNRNMAEIIKETTLRFVAREGFERFMHHPFYHIPQMRINEKALRSIQK